MSAREVREELAAAALELEPLGQQAAVDVVEGAIDPALAAGRQVVDASYTLLSVAMSLSQDPGASLEGTRESAEKVRARVEAVATTPGEPVHEDIAAALGGLRGMVTAAGKYDRSIGTAREHLNEALGHIGQFAVAMEAYAKSVEGAKGAIRESVEASVTAIDGMSRYAGRL